MGLRRISQVFFITLCSGESNYLYWLYRVSFAVNAWYSSFSRSEDGAWPSPLLETPHPSGLFSTSMSPEALPTSCGSPIAAHCRGAKCIQLIHNFSENHVRADYHLPILNAIKKINNISPPWQGGDALRAEGVIPRLPCRDIIFLRSLCRRCG